MMLSRDCISGTPFLENAIDLLAFAVSSRSRLSDDGTRPLDTTIVHLLQCNDSPYLNRPRFRLLKEERIAEEISTKPSFFAVQ